MKTSNCIPRTRACPAALPALWVALLVGLSVGTGAAEDPLAPDFITELLSLYDQLPGVSQPEYDSPTSLALSPGGSILYVAHLTGKRIDGIDVATGIVELSVSVPKSPRGIALSSDGAVLYAACYDDKRPRGMICEIAIASGEVARVLEAGHSPCAPVTAPDGSVLYFANRFEDKIAVMDIASGAVMDTIAVEREPCALALTPDGGKLVAANLVPTGRSDLNDKRSTVSIINAASRTVEARVPLANGAQSLRGVCISPDGAFAYITHVRSNFTQTPLQPILGGWINANGMSVVDLRTNTWVNTVLLDDGQYGGAANPWGIDCTEDYLCIATAGSGELHLMDRKRLHATLDTLSSPDEELVHNLTLSQQFTVRKTLDWGGYRDVCMKDTMIYCAGFYTDDILGYAISDGAPKLTERIETGAEANVDSVRLGEYYFHDARRICLGNWQSCSSCHPDGRVDALNWDPGADGLGNFKNVKNLLHAAVTPPMSWVGTTPSMPICTRASIEAEFFIDPASLEPESRAIDLWLASMRAVPSPHLDHGALTEKAQQGREVFLDRNCDQCHPEHGLFIDGETHLGMKTSEDTGPHDGWWDTPGLHEAWRTAPYLHDGRAATMRDLFVEPISHRLAERLSEEELDALVEYLLSL